MLLSKSLPKRGKRKKKAKLMVSKVMLKSCPRCAGDIQSNRDSYGEYKKCLQCGWMEDAEKSSVPKDQRDGYRLR